nr:hypothetical protein [Kitasatospora acidiphila]
MASAPSWAVWGMTDTYMSVVVTTLACPTWCWMTFKSTWALKAMLAAPWRRS